MALCNLEDHLLTLVLGRKERFEREILFHVMNIFQTNFPASFINIRCFLIWSASLEEIVRPFMSFVLSESDHISGFQKWDWGFYLTKV